MILICNIRKKKIRIQYNILHYALVVVRGSLVAQRAKRWVNVRCVGSGPGAIILTASKPSAYAEYTVGGYAQAVTRSNNASADQHD